MKVHISYTVEVDDDIRREINIYYGEEGLATREGVKAWYRAFGRSMDDDLSSAAQNREEWDERNRTARTELYGESED